MTKEEKELRTCYHWTEWERKAKELEQTNNNLLDVINNQDAKIADLKEQIEKMKCCGNCSHCNAHITTCIPQKRFVKLEDVCKDFELRR